MKNVTTAFVLGAGLGSRLRPYTDNRPKPLLEIHGKPLITYAFDHCLTVGVERFIVNTHHCAEVYDRVFPQKTYQGIPIQFRHEPDLLETGGGLKNIEDLLSPGESLLVYNGDILADFPLNPLLQSHARSGAETTLACRRAGPPKRLLFADGELRDIGGLLHPQIPANLGYTGICCVHPSFLKFIPPKTKISLVPVWLERLQKGTPPAISITDKGSWRDVGTIDVYESLNAPGQKPFGCGPISE